jgi:multicomponent Na+:H+ antiporter subunit G
MNVIQAAIVTALIVVGSFFLLVGIVGLLRLPDVYNRMHATSKATTLGAASIFLAGFVYFNGQAEGLTSLVGILFLFLTAPTGAHMISRSAQKMGIEFEHGATWPGEIDSRPDQPADAEPEEAGD